MAGPLGSNPTYVALITDRCNGATIAEAKFDQLSWGRALDDVSEAKLTVPAGQCDQLGQVRAWRHELHVIRNDDEVWCGPVVTPAACRTGLTLVAQDPFAWLGVRVVHNTLCYSTDCGGAAAPGVTLAQLIVQDALEPDDPCLLEWLQTYGVGAPQERNYPANGGYALDALKDLSRGGCDFTAIGRRMILMQEGYELAQLPMLTCDHFAGDVCTSDDGYGAATRAVVTGKAPDNTTVVTGSAGGTDDYLGLVEVLLNDDTIKTAAAATTQAQGLLRPVAPLLVQPPQGSGLTPDAPVGINDLVPGVMAGVTLSCTGRDATANLRLTKLDVSVDANGETVTPLLQPTTVAPDA